MTTSNDTVKRRYVAEWNIEDSEFDVFGWKRTAMVFDSDCQKLESDNKALVSALQEISTLNVLIEGVRVSPDECMRDIAITAIKLHGGAE